MKEDQKNKIIGFYKQNRRMPSYAEIAGLLGFKSKNAVFRLVKKLLDQGMISKDGRGRLIPKNFGELRVLGLVEAGFPSAAEEELLDTLSLDDLLVENKEASFILRVKGDSMIEAGIQEGDMVIVERGKPPREGDIVIAEVDSEWTMKYYKKKNGQPYLEPANPKYKPIFPKQDLRVVAIVKAVVRKY